MTKKRSGPPPAFATTGRSRHFIPIYDDQFTAPAFVGLPPVAMKVYMILRSRYKGDYTGNKVECPYDAICEMGISRNSISGAIRILEALGFISCDRGGLGNQSSIYRFQEGWKEIRNLEEARAIVKEVRATIQTEGSFRKKAKEHTA